MQQSSTTISGKSIHSIETYISGIFSNSKRKNCSAMGEELSKSHDELYKGLVAASKNITALQEELLLIAQDVIDDPKAKVVIDDSIIAKFFAKTIEGIFENYDSSAKSYVKGLCIVVIGISYNGIFFPIDFLFWFPEDIMKDEYLKKRELAMQLIKKHYDLIRSKVLLIDGLYAQQEFMRELNKLGIVFVARMHANRVVKFANNKQQLQNHKPLKPSKNNKAKMLAGKWKGMELFFVCARIKVKNDDPAYVYLVSNTDLVAKEYVALYKQRWPIEKFFRTTKQKLGLSQCQSRGIDKQKAHIFTVFVAFARMAKKALSSKEKSVDEAINKARRNSDNFFIQKPHLIKTLSAQVEGHA